MAYPRFLSAALGLALVASLGCGASEASRRKDEDAELLRAWNSPQPRIQAASEPKQDSSPEMNVSGDEGTLNAADVEGAIDEHRRELLECYGLGRRPSPRGGASPHGGRALLRFFVDGKGEVVDVAILESNIRNRVVERCLADIAVGVVLPPPSSRKPTTFDYPIEFRDRPRRP